MEASGTAANREARPARILLPIPSYGFDPTEAAIPWKILSAHGHQVELTTPTGARGSADTIMLTGKGLGIWKKLLMARADAVAAYRQMEGSRAFQKPLAYDEVHPASFDAIFLPGGHDKGVREYLESEVLHEIVASFFALGKPVGAVCHGVLLAARSLEAPTGKSVIHDRTVTSLLRSQELLAYYLTRWWLKDYYLTYPGRTVEEEVRSALGEGGRFVTGPVPFLRDDAAHLGRGFAVRDRNLVTARWPGDIYTLSFAFLELLRDLP